jgi:hypothetical protein
MALSIMERNAAGLFLLIGAGCENAGLLQNINFAASTL